MAGLNGPAYVLVAAGKAAHGMATSAVRLLGTRLRRGLVVAPVAVEVSGPLEAIVGSHPVPTPASEGAGRRALAFAKDAPPDGGLLVLLSGGASALMAVPADGVTLEEKARTTNLLLRAGADIGALNAVRKHLSAIKGGWLASDASAPSFTLAISDVVGDDLSVIGSGSTIADPTTFTGALEVLQRHGGIDAYPAAVIARLARGARGELPETPKPGDPRLARSRSWVIGGRHAAMRGAEDEARRRGYVVRVTEAPVTGEARDAARLRLAATAAEASGGGRPLCLISSGETTVRVTGPGRGGRNQEFALAGARALESLGASAVLASAGTDGVDGATDAAGALVDSSTIERARRAGLSPQPFLDENDAHAFFNALGDLIHTGPTGTNVGDLQVLLIGQGLNAPAV